MSLIFGFDAKREHWASIFFKGLSNQLKNPIPDSVHRKPIEINYETGIDSEGMLHYIGQNISCLIEWQHYRCIL